MNWIMSNWVSVVAVFCGGVTFFSIIANATTNKTDDKVLFYLLKVVDVLALSNNKPTELVE